MNCNNGSKIKLSWNTGIYVYIYLDLITTISYYLGPHLEQIDKLKTHHKEMCDFATCTNKILCVNQTLDVSIANVYLQKYKLIVLYN